MSKRRKRLTLAGKKAKGRSKTNTYAEKKRLQRSGNFSPKSPFHLTNGEGVPLIDFIKGKWKSKVVNFQPRISY